jgi:hypothetical protein
VQHAPHRVIEGVGEPPRAQLAVQEVDFIERINSSTPFISYQEINLLHIFIIDTALYQQTIFPGKY